MSQAVGFVSKDGLKKSVTTSSNISSSIISKLEATHQQLQQQQQANKESAATPATTATSSSTTSSGKSTESVSTPAAGAAGANTTATATSSSTPTGTSKSSTATQQKEKEPKEKNSSSSANKSSQSATASTATTSTTSNQSTTNSSATAGTTTSSQNGSGSTISSAPANAAAAATTQISSEHEKLLNPSSNEFVLRNQREYMDAGKFFINQNQFENALKIYEILNDANPNKGIAQILAGHCAFRLRKHEKVISFYKKAMELSAKANRDSNIHFELGIANYRQGNFVESEQNFHKVNVYQAKYIYQPIVDLYKGILKRQNGLFQEASQNDKNIFNQQKTVEILCNAGLQFEQMKELEDAQLCYQKAKQVEGTNFNALKCLSWVLFQKKSYRESTDLIQKAYQQNNKDFEILLILAKNYDQQGQVKQALEYFNKAIQLNNSNANCWCYLGITFFKLNMMKDAFSCFNKSFELENNIETLFNIALLYEIGKHYIEAINLYKQILMVCPDDHMVVRRKITIERNASSQTHDPFNKKQLNKLRTNLREPPFKPSVQLWLEELDPNVKQRLQEEERQELLNSLQHNNQISLTHLNSGNVMKSPLFMSMTHNNNNNNNNASSHTSIQLNGNPLSNPHSSNNLNANASNSTNNTNITNNNNSSVSSNNNNTNNNSNINTNNNNNNNNKMRRNSIFNFHTPNASFMAMKEPFDSFQNTPNLFFQTPKQNFDQQFTLTPLQYPMNSSSLLAPPSQHMQIQQNDKSKAGTHRSIDYTQTNPLKRKGDPSIYGTGDAYQNSPYGGPSPNMGFNHIYKSSFDMPDIYRNRSSSISPLPSQNIIKIEEQQQKGGAMVEEDDGWNAQNKGFKLRKNSEFNVVHTHNTRKASIASNTSPLQRPMKKPSETHSDSDSEKPLKKQIKIVSLSGNNTTNTTSATTGNQLNQQLSASSSNGNANSSMNQNSNFGRNSSNTAAATTTGTGGIPANNSGQKYIFDDELHHAVTNQPLETAQEQSTLKAGTTNAGNSTPPPAKTSRLNIFSVLGSKKPK